MKIHSTLTLVDFPTRLAEARVAARPTRSRDVRRWWADLRAYQVSVLPDRSGGLAGAVATGVGVTDGVGYILWLAAGASVSVQGRLLDIALAQLTDTAAQRAFYFATALGAGLEGLPVRHAVTLHEALLERAFAGSDAWLYMHRDLTDVTAQPAARASTTPGGAVTIRPAGDPAGCDVQGALLSPSLGMVSWLGVAPEQRGHGLGRQLLDEMLAHLRHLGACEVILYVDHDAPGGDRDRSAAIALYRSSGFTEVDHLWSYERS